MKMFCRAALVLAVLAASALGVNAQTPRQGRVVGRVLDAINASPLPGVTVEVPGTPQTTVTDLDGKYTLELPLVTHQIRIALSGFAERVVTVDLNTSAFPVFFNAISPACNFVISNFKSSLSLIVSRTDIAESDNSGPIPSPVINEILYMLKFYSKGILGFSLIASDLAFF